MALDTAMLFIIIVGGMYGLSKTEAALPTTEARVTCAVGTVTIYETGYVSADLRCSRVPYASQSWKKGDVQLRPGAPIWCTVVTKRIPIVGVNLQPTVAPDSCSLTA